MRQSKANISAGLEIIQENIKPNFQEQFYSAPSETAIKRSLGLSPTTELAGAKGVGISSRHFVRESDNYGQVRHQIPTLNNPAYHRDNKMSNFTYNILTGSYIKHK